MLFILRFIYIYLTLLQPINVSRVTRNITIIKPHKPQVNGHKSLQQKRLSILYFWLFLLRGWVGKIPQPFSSATIQFRYPLSIATQSFPLPTQFCYPLSSAINLDLLPTVWIFSKEGRGTREGASSLVFSINVFTMATRFILRYNHFSDLIWHFTVFSCTF